jgi:hypothetical protein
MADSKAELADDVPLAERTSLVPGGAGSAGGSAPREPRPILLALGLATVALLTFAIALDGAWIYDDHTLIARNAGVHSFASWRRWFVTDFWDVNGEVRHFLSRLVYWRPAVTASYALDWKLGDGSPIVFHATNLLWHALVSFLAYRALHRWLGRAVPALVAAALFALHPTKAESVAWIAGRTDVLCTAMILLASEAWAARAKASSRRTIAIFFALEALATALAYTTKEQAIVLSAFVVMEAWVELGRPPIDLGVLRTLARAGVPQLAVAVGYLVARRRWLPIYEGQDYLPPGDRVRIVLETFGRLAKSVFWPSDLSVQQGLMQTVKARFVFDRPFVVAGALFLVVLVVVAVWARRRAPGVTLGLSLFVGLVLPTSNVVPTRMATLVSDRFLYLPLIGLAFAIVAGIELLAEKRRRVGLVAAGACAAFLACASVARSEDFVDESAFWARELRLHPESLEAHRFLIQVAADKHQFRRALELSARAQALAVERYGHSGDEADFAVFGVRFLAALTPDREVPRLKALAAFCEQAADPNATAARLALPDVDLVVNLSRGAAGARLRAQRPRMLVLQADIASRLDDDPTALRLATEAHDACPDCAEIGTLRAMIEARAGAYDRAFAALDEVAAGTGEPAIAERREVLRKASLLGKQAAMAPEGPLRLDLRAMELGALDAWGRAYTVLAPFKDRIKIAPGMAYGFAELAFRAGYPEVATEILRGLVPPEKIAPIQRDWTVKMGWSVAEPAEAGAASSTASTPSIPSTPSTP